MGAYLSTAQECVWTNLQEEHRSWEMVDLKSLCEDGIAQGRHYRVCQCIETRKTAKRKAESGRRELNLPDFEKKRNQLIQTICDKKEVTSMKLAAT